MQRLYLAAAVVGAAVPLACFAPFLAEHGLDLPLFFRQLFGTSVSAFFGADVIISAAVLFLFVYSEGRRRRMRRLWVYALCTLLVGVSLGLPLFLYFRERGLAFEETSARV